MKSPETIDGYIGNFPPEIQEILSGIRETIRKAAPDAEEKISYQMPTFALHGNLLHFAAQKNHIGFYPSPSGIRKFHDEFGDCKWSKGAVQFPLDRPIPLDLIARIVRFRVEENLAKAAAKRTGR